MMLGRRPQHHRLITILGATFVALVLFAAPALAAGAGGVDASSWQHPSGAKVSWGRVVKSGQEFAFIKATEGTSYVNPYFNGDWRDSASAGLMHGAYHYARPSLTPGSATAQARAFAATVGNLLGSGELPPVLDMESTGGLSPSQLISWTSTWLQTVTALTGRRPIIYTYPYFWLTAMGNTTAFSHSYRLWIANYTSASSPTLIGGWTQWTFWQYTSSGHVRGIHTAVDLNRFNGSKSQLQALANM